MTGYDIYRYTVGNAVVADAAEQRGYSHQLHRYHCPGRHHLLLRSQSGEWLGDQPCFERRECDRGEHWSHHAKSISAATTT